MKTNYITKKIGEVCSLIKRGISPKYVEGDGILILNQRCIRNHRISRIEARIHDASKKFSSEKLINVGDVLVNSTGVGTLGRVAQVKEVDEPTLVDSHVTIVRPMDGLFNHDYFGWMMIFVESIIQKLGTGSSGQTELSKSALEKITITYSESLSEQKRIVEILDEKLGKVREAICLREEAIKNTEKILSAKLNEIFEQGRIDGWKEVTLGAVCCKTSNINWKNEKVSSFKYIDLSSVSRKSLSVTETKMVDEKNAPSRAKKIVEEGDVIFGTTRPTLMRVTILSKEYDKQICSTGFCVLRAQKELILPRFIFYFIQSKLFMDRMEKIQTGASYPAVSDSKVLASEILLPEILLQRQLINELDNLSDQIKNLRTLQAQQRHSLNKLEQAYLREAFNGEL